MSEKLTIMWLYYRTYEKLFQSIIYNFGHLHLSCVYRQSNILRVYSCFIYVFQVCCKQFSVTKSNSATNKLKNSDLQESWHEAFSPKCLESERKIQNSNLSSTIDRTDGIQCFTFWGNLPALLALFLFLLINPWN